MTATDLTFAGATFSGLATRLASIVTRAVGRGEQVPAAAEPDSEPEPRPAPAEVIAAAENPDIDPVLAWVNTQREAAGQKPLETLPAGKKASPAQCPLANALPGRNWAVYPINGCALQLEEGRTVHLPAAVAGWALAFDKGQVTV